VCNLDHGTRFGKKGALVTLTKQVLGPALRFHSDEAQATEVAIGARVLNRMLDLGRPNSVCGA